MPLIAEPSTDPYALVVEDEPIIQEHVSEILKEAGFRPLEADNADHALPILDELGEHITLLFTDVEMAGTMDGFSLARFVATCWPDIEIVIASGRIVPQPGDLPPRATFISKPFSAEIVLDHLRAKLPDGKKPEPLRRAV